MLVSQSRAGFAVSFLLCALGACSQGAPSAKDVLDQADRMVRPQPGLYRSTSRLTAFELPGASPQEAERMRSMMGGLDPQQHDVCVTEKDSEHGFAALLRDMQNGDCHIDSFDAGAVRMRSEMHCTAADGSTSHVTMTGTGGARASHMELAVEQDGRAIPGGTMRLHFVIDSRRTGECPVTASRETVTR